MNLDIFAFAPVFHGMWKQHEVFDGTYSLEDLLDAHEIMAVMAENKRRAEDYAASQREVD